LMFGFLEKTSAALMELFMFDGSASIKGFNFISSITKPVIHALGRDGLLGSVLPGSAGGAVMIVVGVALIFLSIRQMGSLLNKVMVGRAEEIFHAAIGRGALTGILAGAVMTIVVQSSSTTTSLIVPLAGAGMLALDRVYPFTLGANIGTCITSLLAATAITGPMAVPALQVALVHLLYNTLGVIVIYGIPWLRRIPLICAEWLSGMTVKRKSFAVVYVVGAFFVAPAALVGLSMLAPAPMVAEDPLPGVTEAELLEIEEDAEEMSEEFPDFAVE
jgi:sodium-dependent phosphate cotransporter